MKFIGHSLSIRQTRARVSDERRRHVHRNSGYLSGFTAMIDQIRFKGGKGGGIFPLRGEKSLRLLRIDEERALVMSFADARLVHTQGFQ
ncbi:MAG: hypothetical protein WCR04_01280 [Fibrobacteraceae bacterium]